MRTTRILLTALLSMLLLASCGPRTEKVIIISTSDIHSKLDMLPGLATLIDQAHAQDTAQVFVVDAGDRWTGDPFVDMAPHAGRPIIEQMNRLGYDVATYGNHEFDMGLDTLQLRTQDAEFPIVLANVNTGSTVWKQPKPYVIKRAGGVRVGFLGLVTNYAGGHPDGDDAIFEGTEFFSPEWAGERYGKELRERCDLMVILSHCGLDRDTTNVASAFPMADLIVSGHTHEKYSGKAGGVAVVQGLNKLRAVGLTTATITNGKVSDLKTEYITLPEEGKESVKEEVAEYRNVPYLTEPIGTLTTDATKMGLAHLMADEGRKVAGTDLAFYHVGGTRLAGLPAGDVSRGDIYELEPFKSFLVVTTMTLADIKEMIINKFNDTTNQKESHRVDLIPSGLTYTILTNSKGDAVDVRFRPEVRKEVYTVAIADYVYGNKVYAYTRRAADGTTEQVTDYLIKRLSQGPYTPNNTPRGEIKIGTK
ncbi:MAG: bifunctional metallophosphatase/5'-nucleotidase [Tidjanibacter sp.]|nr:bifunctional metallophosphatase/5'-nucleotidase [Tidjanibacter sp.]